MEVHYASQRSDWETPTALYQILDDEFGFELDVCASPENAKADQYLTPEHDGLTCDWGDAVCWMNPPYGRELSHWIEKAVTARYLGATVVCLVPARIGSRWFRLCCREADEIRLLHSRLTFEGADQPAPFPSCIVVLRARTGRLEPEDLVQPRAQGWFTLRAMSMEERWIGEEL